MTKTEISAEQMADIRRDWAAEDPDATAEQWERLREAAAEPSISGSLRRAIHAGRRTVIQLAQDIGLDSQDLSEWMQGVRTLRSDVLDRMGIALGATVSVPPRESSRQAAAPVSGSTNA